MVEKTGVLDKKGAVLEDIAPIGQKRSYSPSDDEK